MPSHRQVTPAPTLENARRDYRYQCVYDLAEARRYPPAVVDRALDLLTGYTRTRA